MNEQKIRNTFNKMYVELQRFHKVVRKDGLLEKSIMEIGGDPSYLNDMREHIDYLMNSLEDAEYGALAHMDESAKSQGKQLKEGVLDGGDEDGFMARSQLYFLARDAIHLHGMIDDRDNLEPWVQSKISQSAQSIEAVRRYKEYKDFNNDSGEVEEGYSILPNIDRERYQDRDGLEGPIMTRSGKVVYYDANEGKYYDPDTDMYMTYDEWRALDPELPIKEAFGKPKLMFNGKEIDPDTVIYDMQDISDQVFVVDYGVEYIDGTPLSPDEYDAFHDDPEVVQWIVTDYMDNKAPQSEGFSSDAQRKAAFANGYDPEKKKKKEATDFVSSLKQRAINELELDPADGWSTGGKYSIKAKSKYKDNIKTGGGKTSTDSSYSDTIQSTDHKNKTTDWMQDKGSRKDGSETHSTAFAQQDGTVDFYKVKDGEEVQNTSNYERPVAIAMKKQTQKALGEDEGDKPYICVHAKKGKHECHAPSSYAAAKKAAAHWKLKSTAGIDAHLAEEITEDVLNEIAPLVVAGLANLARIVGPTIARTIFNKGGSKLIQKAVKNPKATLKWMNKNKLKTAGIGAGGGGAYDAGTVAYDDLSGERADREINKMKQYKADADARRKSYDDALRNLNSESFVKSIRNKLESK